MFGAEWVSFPGGELEGQQPTALCPGCRHLRQRAHRATEGGARTLCFACYRAELDRQKALASAGELATASDARFQFQLPFESVNHGRLAALKAERASARAATGRTAAGRADDRRRSAQMAARRALRHLAATVPARPVASAARDHAMSSVLHAAELQLPEAWIPFVMAR